MDSVCETLNLPGHRRGWGFSLRSLVWLAGRLGQWFPHERKSCNLYTCGSISYHQMGNQKQKEQKINMNINKRRAEVKCFMIAAFAGVIMYACSD